MTDYITRATGTDRPGALLDYMERVKAEAVEKSLARHGCSQACGVSPEPGCPAWGEHREHLDLPRRDPRWQEAARHVPFLLAQYQEDVLLAAHLRPAVEQLLRVADLLPDELLELLTRAWAAGGAGRRRRLARLLIADAAEEVREAVREVVAAELPGAVAACNERARLVPEGRR